MFSKYEPALLRSMAEIVMKDLNEEGSKSKEMIERLNREYGIKPSEAVAKIQALSELDNRF